MNDEKKRAYRDAQADYIYSQARTRLIAWRLFWAVILMGMGYRFFMVCAVDQEKPEDVW